MKRQLGTKFASLGLYAALCTSITACGGDDGAGAADESTEGADAADETAGDATDGETTDDGGDAGDAGDWTDTGDAGNGDVCDYHRDCESNYCFMWDDFTDGTCEAPPPWGTMIVQGTVYDFVTREPAEGVSLKLASAIGAASNPQATQSLGDGVSGADGRFSFESTEVNGTILGVVVVNTKDGYFDPTVSIVAGPMTDSNNYLPGPDVHNQYVMPLDVLQAWNDALADDPTAAEFLPIGGPEGGVVGRVWDVDTESPIVGATVVSDDGDGTSSQIRYLSEDMASFNGDGTSSNGFFVILNPALGEGFSAYDGDEEEIGGTVAGSAANSIVAVAIG